MENLLWFIPKVIFLRAYFNTGWARSNETNLAFNVIAVGSQELGQLVETCEVVVKVWRTWSGPVKACDDHKKKEGQLHLDSKFWRTDYADQPGEV